MLENENSLLAQDIARQNEADNLLGTLQIVGRIGKNDIETLWTVLQIEKSVRLDRVDVRGSEVASRTANEVVVDGVDFDRGNAARTARGEFVANRACAGEEVEDIGLFVIDYVAQYVKQILLGEVRSRTCAEIAGRIDGATAICATYDSHTTCLK